jgi:hypothetical protein
MAFYNYQCAKKKPCKIEKLTPELFEKLCLADPPHPKGILVWTERHGMNENPKYKCPICNGKAVVSSHGVDVTGYIRGNCYLNRQDAKKQMDIRLLETGQDPYAGMRTAGEVDHLKRKLRGKVKEKKVF